MDKEYQIEFMAWCHNDKKMIPVGQIEFFEDGNVSINDGLLMIVGNKKQFDLLQYVGLTDKNNKKIFENDIIKFKNMVRECVGVIKFGGSFWGIKYLDSEFDGLVLLNRFDCENNVEIIGNIYDNDRIKGLNGRTQRKKST